MITWIKATYTDNPDIGEITFKYNTKTDKELLDRVEQFISDNQPTCSNCQNYYKGGTFCGYTASCCKIHGDIDVYGNPHSDFDGSKCGDYRRIE